jgi:hypothetical protein
MRRKGLRSTRMISAFSAFRMNPTDFIAPNVIGLLLDLLLPQLTILVAWMTSIRLPQAWILWPD